MILPCFQGKILEHIMPDRYEVERTDIPGITSVISHHDIFHPDARIPLKDIDVSQCIVCPIESNT